MPDNPVIPSTKTLPEDLKPCLVPKSWGDLHELCFADSWNDSLRRYRSPFVFRGVGHSTDILETSLMRLGGPYLKLERHLLRNFRKYAHQDWVDENSVWHWLAVAQHHGLPTRLLDWTYSPLVALHFATEALDDFENDGLVWKVNYQLAARLLPESLGRRLREEGSNVFTEEILGEMLDSLDALERLPEKGAILFYEPASLDDRIVNQFALFSLLVRADLPVSAILRHHPELYERILIPAQMKWEIRDKLDQSNITERVLYPGLDGVCRWLKRQYSSRMDL
ncbi:MAG: FRG domain-containing protein [Puniceicoccaceae bacterium]